MANMTEFADNLRRLRREKKITQAEASERAGVPQPLWSLYERGLRSPSIQQAERLAQAIGVALKKLV